MKRWNHKLTLAMTITSASVASQSKAAVVYDLADDFSLINNPNGSWSYNAGATPLPFTQFQWGGVPNETFWSNSTTVTNPPAWTKASTVLPGANDWQIGDVIAHSTNGGSEVANGLANVVWTAPTTGVIDITGRAWDAAHFPTRNTDWSLAVDGVLVAQLTTGVFGLTRNDAAAQFSNNLLFGQSLDSISIDAGDTVVLILDAKGTEAGHFVGTDLTITYIPEPASTALFGIASCVLLSRGCSTRQAISSDRKAGSNNPMKSSDSNELDNAFHAAGSVESSPAQHVLLSRGCSTRQAISSDREAGSNNPMKLSDSNELDNAFHAAGSVESSPAQHVLLSRGCSTRQAISSDREAGSNNPMKLSDSNELDNAFHAAGSVESSPAQHVLLSRGCSTRQAISSDRKAGSNNPMKLSDSNELGNAFHAAGSVESSPAQHVLLSRGCSTRQAISSDRKAGSNNPMKLSDSNELDNAFHAAGSVESSPAQHVLLSRGCSTRQAISSDREAGSNNPMKSSDFENSTDWA